VIRVSEEAKRLLSTLWAPDGEVMRLVLRQPEADEAGGLAFGHGRGEGADQIVQHAGTQVLRVDRSVRRGDFYGSSVEAVAVTREEREVPTRMIAENLSLEAQG
jgi:hypothetical protein